MRRKTLIITAIFLTPAIWSCTQTKQAEPVPNRAKIVQPRDMGQEPVALAHTGETPRFLELPRNIGGGFPKAKDCAMSNTPECEALWRNIQTTRELFIDCMAYQSSEETPRLCRQLYDVDGDNLVTLADYAYFEAFHQFSWILPARAK